MQGPVKEFMTALPHTIGHDMELKMASEKMKEFKCHHLPVLDGGHLVGLISARDLQVAEKSPSANSLKVEDIMTDEPVVVDPNTLVGEVAKIMADKEIGSVIVQGKENQAWGIFTSTDALKLLQAK